MIIHGENIVQSRKRLSELVEKQKTGGMETVVLDGGKISLSELRQLLESGSFYGKTRLLVLENLLSSQKSREKENIIEYLEKGNFDNDLIIWESKEIKTNVLLNVTREIFKLTPLIFHFLDSLKQGSAKRSLEIFSELARREEPETIFYMLVRQIRFLIIVCDSGNSDINNLAPWQKEKYLAQAKLFGLARLKELYQKLLEIDFGQKTSGDVFSLSSRLELLVATL